MLRRIVWILYRNVYALYIHYRYTVEVCMSIGDVVVYCVG